MYKTYFVKVFGKSHRYFDIIENILWIHWTELFETGQRAKKLWQCTWLTGEPMLSMHLAIEEYDFIENCTAFSGPSIIVIFSFSFAFFKRLDGLRWFLLRWCGAPCEPMTINAEKGERNTIRCWTTRSQSFAQQRLNFFFCSSLKIACFFYSQSLFHQKQKRMKVNKKHSKVIHSHEKAIYQRRTVRRI